MNSHPWLSLLVPVLLCLCPGSARAGQEASLPLSEADIQRIASAIDRQSCLVRVLFDGTEEMRADFRKFVEERLERIGKKAVFERPGQERDGWVEVKLRVGIHSELSTYTDALPGMRLIEPGRPFRCELEAGASVGVEFDKSKPPEMESWRPYVRHLGFEVTLYRDELPMKLSELGSHEDVARRRDGLEEQMTRCVSETITKKAIPLLANSPHSTPRVSARLHMLRGEGTYPGEKDIDPRSAARFSRQMRDIELIGSYSPVLATHLALEGLEEGYIVLGPSDGEPDEERTYMLRGVVLDSLLRMPDPRAVERVCRDGPEALRPAGVVGVFQRAPLENRNDWPPTDLLEELAELLSEWKQGVAPGTARAEWIPKRAASGLLRGLRAADSPEAAEILFDLLHWRLRHTRWSRGPNGEYSYGNSESAGFAYPVCEELGLELILGESLHVLSNHKKTETRQLLRPLVKRRSALSRGIQRRLGRLFSREERGRVPREPSRRKLAPLRPFRPD